MSILDKIITEKEKEVAELKKKEFHRSHPKSVTSFRERVKDSDRMCIISEIKRSSPSKGEIRLDVDPVEQAKQYEAAGASAISVLTDRTFFNGSMEDLKAVREAVELPILCKDFIIHPIQIDQAKDAGANIILLIAAALSDEQLHSLYQYACSLDLEVLCEVHNEEEMHQVLQLDPEIIGINNRDLNTFEVNLATTERLASMVANPDTILISESGIRTGGDVLRAKEAGANAILVGETLMRSVNLQDTFHELQLTTQEKEVK
ncbi:indole-3-glycerol phosphate synthase TrpC [Virgibacillus xinjiangensis]|uniref:Indole-3-glycerol phosphate synthase n=1 Tax=Virgibacillus xinjiangensis TaxID=393090 RepID=A0ABV7CZJ6_9BACI